MKVELEDIYQVLIQILEELKAEREDMSQMVGEEEDDVDVKRKPTD